MQFGAPDHNVGAYGGTPKTPKQECCDKYCSVRYILINYCTRVKENFMEKYNETWEKPKSDLLNEIVRESDRKRTDNHPAARSIINTMVMKGVSKSKGSGCKRKRPQRKRNKNGTKRNCRKHRATPNTNKPSPSSLTPLKITKTIRKSRRKCICCRQKRIKAPKIHQDAKLGIEQGHQIPINLDFNIKDFINQ
ncbi:PREDICTED: uncharacterized protein LOC108560928 isoform X2 [Nicrophorus vespilloides]|uniref:Uncharacterized protein LOC108560928 isoform X2 n=1 Tax=Nicrophorus vespilloides TaxID=110193 RepID=A0ABM1MHU0_NICVS|nr:PREDICTED: uncharacterized protein LOC108560928 isoform X2 [Nicrophorus vespilloides]